MDIETDPFVVSLDIAENFAFAHQHEAHRRAWLATIDPALLREAVINSDYFLEVWDMTVGDACRDLGYEEPDHG